MVIGVKNKMVLSTNFTLCLDDKKEVAVYLRRLRSTKLFKIAGSMLQLKIGVATGAYKVSHELVFRRKTLISLCNVSEMGRCFGHAM